MSDITYDCPYCRALLKDGTENCTVCGSKMNIAVLVCSHPIGDVHAGAKWNLYPRSYTLGSGEYCNIRIDAGIGERAIRLQYSDGYYKIETSSAGTVTKKETGFSLRIGGGMLTLHYLMEISEYRNAVLPGCSIALSSVCQMSAMKSNEDIYEKLLSAVLRLTGLEKAYYFSVNRNMEMQMEVCRAFNNTEIDQRFCEFSESVIQDAVTVENDIVCMDLNRCATSSMSDSMQNLHLGQVICIPVRDSNDVLVGAVYADTRVSNLMSPTELSHFKPVLRMLAKMVGMRIGVLSAAPDIRNVCVSDAETYQSKQDLSRTAYMRKSLLGGDVIGEYRNKVKNR